MAKRKSRDNEAQLDELGSDPGQVGSDSAGQSGDTQGLSQIADAAAESVEELADTEQAYEAEAVDGVEDAADHPERPAFRRATRLLGNPESRLCRFGFFAKGTVWHRRTLLAGLIAKSSWIADRSPNDGQEGPKWRNGNMRRSVQSLTVALTLMKNFGRFFRTMA